MTTTNNHIYFITPERGKDYITCRICGGMGWEKKNCGKCRGTGRINGTCTYCWGRGWIQEDCTNCGGWGVVPRR